MSNAWGTWHHVGVPYLDQYLREFDYRFNRRKISDVERFALLFRQVAGKRLTLVLADSAA